MSVQLKELSEGAVFKNKVQNWRGGIDCAVSTSCRCFAYQCWLLCSSIKALNGAHLTQFTFSGWHTKGILNHRKSSFKFCFEGLNAHLDSHANILTLSIPSGEKLRSPFFFFFFRFTLHCNSYLPNAAVWQSKIWTCARWLTDFCFSVPMFCSSSLHTICTVGGSVNTFFSTANSFVPQACRTKLWRFLKAREICFGTQVIQG